MKCGVQVSSFRPVLTNEAQVRAAFAKIRAMGCRYVQLQWIDPAVPIPVIARLLRENDLISLSIQDFYQNILEEKDYFFSLNQATGGTWVCVSRIPERLKSRAGLDQYVVELGDMARELEQRWGQRLCLHPVAADFQPIAGIDPVAYLLEQLPELEICADLYHLNKVGINIQQWLETYSGRVCMVHFKDYALDQGKEKLVPAGQGQIPFLAAKEALCSIPYGFVEQETWDMDPFQAIEQALQWAKEQFEI